MISNLSIGTKGKNTQNPTSKSCKKHLPYTTAEKPTQPKSRKSQDTRSKEKHGDYLFPQNPQHGHQITATCANKIPPKQPQLQRKAKMPKHPKNRHNPNDQNHRPQDASTQDEKTRKNNSQNNHTQDKKNEKK